MWCITKEDPHGIVPKYSPWGLTLGDVPQIAAYPNYLFSSSCAFNSAKPAISPRVVFST